MKSYYLTSSLAALLLAACQPNSSEDVKVTPVIEAPKPTLVVSEGERWYQPAQVEQGKALFGQYCAACHGSQAQGLTANWKQTDENGNYPPPPLNGSAHAWHHPKEILLYTLREGGVPLGGQMPPFGEVLTAPQMDAVIAYFQSLWSDEIYQKWWSIEQKSRQ